MVRGANLFAYHNLEGFLHVGIFQLFEVKLESCVFWLADFFQAKAEGHHQQVVITSNVCSWKTSGSGNVHSRSEALPHKNVINLVCGVVHLGYAMSIFWMLCDDQTWRRMGSARLYFAQDSPCDDNTQPYYTGSVAARVNKDRAFRRTPGRRCQMCCWCIIEDSRKRQHQNRHLEHKDTKSRRETSGTNARNGQVQIEHPWTL